MEGHSKLLEILKKFCSQLIFRYGRPEFYIASFGTVMHCGDPTELITAAEVL